MSPTDFRNSKFTKNIKSSTEFVKTPQSFENLRAVAVALALHVPVLLIGNTGSGKTMLVEHVAQLTGRTDGINRLVKLQMGDDTDSKVCN